MYSLEKMRKIRSKKRKNCGNSLEEIRSIEKIASKIVDAHLLLAYHFFRRWFIFFWFQASLVIISTEPVHLAVVCCKWQRTALKAFAKNGHTADIHLANTKIHQFCLLNLWLWKGVWFVIHRIWFSLTLIMCLKIIIFSLFGHKLWWRK